MRAKIAARKAATIVEEATAHVVASRPSPPQDGELARAHEVRRLRDEGKLSWMAIGAQLGLPGSKSGAGAARRYYAMANNGEVPRTLAPRKGSTPRPTGPASRGVPAYLRKERLVREGHVIPRDMPDEEVEALLVGRRIEWAIDLARLSKMSPEQWGEDKRWKVEDAKVHIDARWVKVVRDEDTDERVVYFREYLGWDSDRNRPMSGPTRCVRVDSIYTVA